MAAEDAHEAILATIDAFADARAHGAKVASFLRQEGETGFACTRHPTEGVRYCREHEVQAALREDAPRFGHIPGGDPRPP